MCHRIVIRLAVPVLLAVIAGCGGGDDDPTRPTKPAAQPTDATAEASQANRARDERRPANAVTTSAGGAAVDLQYEVTPRPEQGQPFTIQLAFVPQTPADSIEAQLSGTPGLRITSAETVRFADVLPGERYTTDVLVIGDKPGLYYVGVVAKMATQVQTDARTFSVPIVVGTPSDATAAESTPDASGQEKVTQPAQEGRGS